MTAELVCSASDPAWLERRREGITATDIVTIAGLVTWDSPWALYHRKLGLLPEVEQSDRMRLGSWLEGQIGRHWEAISSEDAFSRVAVGRLFRSSARTWQLATPDLAYKSCVVECKTSATREGWGPDGSDVVPPHVRAQVLWQMDTLGVGTGHVAVVFLPSGEFRSYTIRHEHRPHPLPHSSDVVATLRAEVDPCAVCAEVDGLRDLGFGFWSRILTRRPPDLDGLEVTTDALRFLHPAPGPPAVQISLRLLAAYDDAAADKKSAEQTYRAAQNAVREYMGDSQLAIVGTEPVFRRTIGKRAGYTVPPGETDTLRRIGKDKD